MTDAKKPLGQRIMDKARGAARTITAKITDFVQYDLFGKFKVGTTEIAFPIDVSGDTVWATQKQMAELFGTQVPAISKRIAALFAEGELDPAATVSELEIVQREGGRDVTRRVEHYNLDVILAVGYGISGPRASEFRKWASQILKNYLVEGYALNGRRLAGDPEALRNLAKEVRALRTSEKAMYEQAREMFKLCSVDYDGNSTEARTFFSTSQNMFHFAASEQTAAQIIMARCDASKPNMGMTALGNRQPTFTDGCIAKNYLTADELHSMELLGEQFLLYAESMAHRGKKVSMARLLKKLEDLIEFHEYPVFPGYSGTATRDQANDHVRAQLAAYKRLPPPRSAA